MAATKIATIAQTIEMNDVSDVVVTPIQHDDVMGDNFREIRIMGTPPDGDTVIPVNLVVRIRASDTEPLKVTVPENEF